MKPASMDDYAQKYVLLAVALGERDPDALDYYAGPENQVAGIRRRPPKLSQIKQSATELVFGLEALPTAPGQDAARKRFLLGQLHAIAARADFVSRVRLSLPKPTFEQEAREFFDIDLSSQSPGRLNGIRDRIARLLAAKHQLAERYASFEQGFVIPEERLPAVIAQSLEICRNETLRHIKLPPGESVSVEYVRNKPWSAYSYYKGHYRSLIEINVDLDLTVDRALQLACHEGYPGHHVFNSLAEQNQVQGRHHLEWLVQPTFSPQSFLSEASATVAGELAFSLSERAQIEEQTLFRLAGIKPREVRKELLVEDLVDQLHPAELAIAREYLDDRLEFARAGEALESQVLMTHTDATLRYLNEYRSYVVTYTEGQDRITSWINERAARSGDARSGSWKAFADLVRSPDIFFQP